MQLHKETGRCLTIERLCDVDFTGYLPFLCTGVSCDVEGGYWIPLHIDFFLWCCGPTRAMTSSVFRFLDHTQRPTTVVKTPLDEWSVRRSDLYMKTRNTHKGQISTPSAEYEPTISAGERPQTYARDDLATAIGYILLKLGNKLMYIL